MSRAFFTGVILLTWTAAALIPESAPCGMILLMALYMIFER